MRRAQSFCIPLRLSCPGEGCEANSKSCWCVDTARRAETAKVVGEQTQKVGDEYGRTVSAR